MVLPLDLVTLSQFAAALVRAAGFVAIAPPFAGGLFSVRVRGVVAIVLGIACAGVVPPSVATLSLAGFIVMLLTQLVFGLALGFAVLISFSAARAAGEMVDNLTGSTLSVVYDPLSGAASPIFGRFFQLAFTGCFFALNGHLLLAAGFRRSFEALPLVKDLHPGQLAGSAAGLVAQLAVMSLEIAGPLIIALFLVEVALGLLARAAPTLNVLVLGLGVKALLAVVLVIAFAPAIPGLTARLIDQIGQAMTLMARAFS